MSGINRMDATKDAIGSIIEQYSELGELNVNIIDFSQTVSTSDWILNNDNGVKDYLNFIEPSGEAYYDDAINAVMQSHEAPEVTHNILYFMTDGAPSAGHQLDDTLEAEWSEYRDANFDEVYAVALGGSLNSNFDMNGSLDAITGDSNNSFMITSASDLEATLLATVESDKRVSGDLIDSGENSMFDFGADGGYISSVVIGDKEYNYNAVDGEKLTVTTADGAILTLDFVSGEYTYQANLATVSEGKQESIMVMGVDGDGDKVESELIINVDTEAVKDTDGDIIITNIIDGTFEIPAFTLLANDNPSIMKGFNDTHTVDMELSYENETFTIDPTKDFEYDFGKEMGRFEKGDEDLALNRKDFGHTNSDSVKDSSMPTVQVEGEFSENDADMMSLNLKEGEWLVLDIDNGYNGDADASVDTTLTLYTKDADGNLVEIAMNEESKIVTGGTGSTYENDPFLSYQAKDDAEYFVKVSNSGENNEGTYTLMLSILPTFDDMRFEYTTQEGEGSVVNFMRTALDTLYGSDKSEIFLAEDEDTQIFADGGDDTLEGGAGNDTLEGGDGSDILNAGDGSDILFGGADNDSLDGGAGDDTLSGGSGHDRLDGGLGEDTLEGGEGNDTLVYDANDSIIDGGVDSDSLIVNEDIDFSNIDTIKNIENINIENSDVNVKLNLDSLIDMTDDDNTLTIFGDEKDSLTLENGDGEWSFEGQEQDAKAKTTLNIYEQDGSIVKVDEDIEISIA